MFIMLTPGQLTSIGLAQHKTLGKQFRDLYVTQYQLLDEQFRSNDIWIRSTDVPRTIQSCMVDQRRILS